MMLDILLLILCGVLCGIQGYRVGHKDGYADAEIEHSAAIEDWNSKTDYYKYVKKDMF